jgi:UPF0042 nucleotide-binding protein
VLVRRYESNRREHPLQGTGTLIDGITAERALLTGIAGEADLWVDTSDLNIHQLRATLENAFAREGKTPPLTATVLSFGFKYGLPLDADLVVDARFLPNPHWLPDLRPHTGQDPTSATTSSARTPPGPSSTGTPTCCACSSPATAARASAT